MGPHRYNTRSSAKKRYRAFFPRRDQKQLKLKECRKVVVLRTSQGCFTAEDLESARLVLEDGSASRQEVLGKLRMLASLDICYSHLESSGKLAESVGKVTGHEDLEVASTARRIYDKWQNLVVKETEKIGLNLTKEEDRIFSDPVENVDLTCEKMPPPLPESGNNLQGEQ